MYFNMSSLPKSSSSNGLILSIELSRLRSPLLAFVEYFLCDQVASTLVDVRSQIPHPPRVQEFLIRGDVLLFLVAGNMDHIGHRRAQLISRIAQKSYNLDGSLRFRRQKWLLLLIHLLKFALDAFAEKGEDFLHCCFHLDGRAVVVLNHVARNHRSVRNCPKRETEE